MSMDNIIKAISQMKQKAISSTQMFPKGFNLNKIVTDG